MRRPFLAVLFLTSALSPVLAQSAPPLGANITRTYDVTDLMTRPALLTLGKGDMLILDLPGDVSAVVTPQASSLDIPEPLGNVVVMTAKVSTGKAQIFVQLQSGKYASFLVNFVPGGSGMKRVKITDDPDPDLAQPRATPARPPTSRSLATPPAGGADVPPRAFAPIPVPASATPAADPVSTPSTSDVIPPAAPPTAVTPVVASLTRPQPDWLRLGARVEHEPRADVLIVTLANVGTRTLHVGAEDAVVTVDGRRVLATLDAEVDVRPRAIENVRLTLAERVAPGSVVRVTWTGRDEGLRTTYRFSAEAR